MLHIIKQKLQTTSLEFFSVQGGSINKTYRIETHKGPSYFCKLNSASKFPHLFRQEASGLNLIAATHCIQTPKIIESFEVNDEQILILEWINQGLSTEAFWKVFGQQLAQLHQVSSTCFGLYENNYMGSVLQFNQPGPSWIEFFSQQRLGPLLKSCMNQKAFTSSQLLQFESIIKRLPSFFEDEKPSLLHGDLWSGNFVCQSPSQPVLIDPAVYFGHRSMDLAMSTLFGGFPQTFYDAYHYHFPFPSNYKEQWQICNLYPLLIHLFLFGKSYLPPIEKILKRFT